MKKQPLSQCIFFSQHCVEDVALKLQGDPLFLSLPVVSGVRQGYLTL